MPQTNPYNANNFKAEIDGIVITSFLSITGIEADVAVVDYREGSDPLLGARKLPGAAKYSNLVLKRGINGDFSLWEWMNKTLNGKTERKNLSVVLMDEAGEEKVRFNFTNAFPVKWSGPSLNAESSDVAMETLEIAHEGLRIG